MPSTCVHSVPFTKEIAAFQQCNGTNHHPSSKVTPLSLPRPTGKDSQVPDSRHSSAQSPSHCVAIALLEGSRVAAPLPAPNLHDDLQRAAVWRTGILWCVRVPERQRDGNESGTTAARPEHRPVLCQLERAIHRARLDMAEAIRVAGRADGVEGGAQTGNRMR